MARFILSQSIAFQKFKQLKKFSDIISYSLKTNHEVGKILEATDCMFSVHNEIEVSRISDKARIWYFPQGWTREESDNIFGKGVNKFVIDNENDLNVLLENLDTEIELLLRMRLRENTIHTGKHYVFGFYASKVNELIPQIRKNPNIKKVGIHFHRKTQNVSEWRIRSELKDAIKDWGIDYVNIGGGLPAEYKNFRKEALNSIFNEISDLKDWLNQKKIRLILEPGRYIAAPSVKLESNIINIYDNNIIVDCSIFNSALDTWVANIRLLVDGELDSGTAYTIKGSTPDSADIFRYKVYLDKPEIGDKIVFLNAGAYNYRSDFCDLPKLRTIVLD